MHKKSLDTRGFGLPGVLAVVLVLVVIVGGGFLVKDHKTKAPVSSSATSRTTSKTSKSSTTATADPYAGWQSQCDPTYHYCFKYPSNWTTDNGELLSPSKTVVVNYQNPDNRDGGRITFTPSYVSKLARANQDVTIVGGYYPTSGAVGNYAPLYSVVDSSILTTFPLAVGTQATFVNNPIFTDTSASTATYGAFVASPAVSINTVSDAQAWLNSADAKTSRQILQSFDYQN
jgi:hypothetical protein